MVSFVNPEENFVFLLLYIYVCQMNLYHNCLNMCPFGLLFAITFCIAVTVVQYCWILLHPFQIIRRFGFSRCIDFTMYLDIKCISRCIAKPMSLEKPKRLIIWNGGSICLSSPLHNIHGSTHSLFSPAPDRRCLGNKSSCEIHS